MRKDIAKLSKKVGFLEPLPFIGVPFEQLGMNIVRPPERTKSGNRSMLVITDCATKYPEFYPPSSLGLEQ